MLYLTFDSVTTFLLPYFLGVVYFSIVCWVKLELSTPEIVILAHRIDETVRSLKERGWKSDRVVELPNSPCYPFQDPNGVHLAIYENCQPDTDRKFAGIFDI